MPSSHLPAIALIFATISLSLPVRADEVTTNDVVQTAIINGNHNTVNQNSNNTIRTSSRGNGDSRGTSIRTRQTADVMGNNNTVRASSHNRVENSTPQNR
jgi:hypothetical protein